MQAGSKGRKSKGIAVEIVGDVRKTLDKHVGPRTIFVAVLGGFLILVMLVMTVFTGSGPLSKFSLTGLSSHAGYDKAGNIFINDIPVQGDYDGDGKADLAVWRQSDGTWYVKKSSDGKNLVFAWGSSAAPYYDVPVPADYDGDGITDFAVWRWGNGTWYIKNSSDGSQTIFAWGSGAKEYNDIPVVGDFDGDGKADLAVWRQSDGTWYIKQSSDGKSAVTAYGSSAQAYRDFPTQADFDGDGKTDLAVWRKATGTWYVRNSEDSSDAITAWGIAEPLPVSTLAPTPTPVPVVQCPNASVNASLGTVKVKDTVSLSAPAGFAGVAYTSNRTSVLDVTGSVGKGVSVGQALVSGSGFYAPANRTCSLSGTLILVRK